MWRLLIFATGSFVLICLIDTWPKWLIIAAFFALAWGTGIGLDDDDEIPLPGSVLWGLRFVVLVGAIVLAVVYGVVVWAASGTPRIGDMVVSVLPIGLLALSVLFMLLVWRSGRS